MTTATFERLSRDPAFQELFKISRHRELPKNHVVLAEGSKPGCLYLIISGSIAVCSARCACSTVLRCAAR
jgi:CRP-like cAMP-binding protein